MNLNKYIIGLWVIVMIMGVALLFTVDVLVDIESARLNILYHAAGGAFIGLGFAFLYKHVMKRKHPEVLRRQQIELKDERNIIIRDRAGFKTFTYLTSMILIAFIVYDWFDVEYNYAQVTFWILFSSWLIYYALSHYYEKRL